MSTKNEVTALGLRRMWSNPTGEEYSSAGETKAVRYDRFQHTSVLGRIKVWTYSIPPISFFICTMAASSESAVTMHRCCPFLAVTM